MSSETTNPDPKSEEAEPFNIWLARRAADRGYDVHPGGGGRSALARAAEVSPAQIGRALDGQATPSTDTLRSLAQPLGVPFVEMLFRAGMLTVEDIFELISEFQKAASKRQGDIDYSQYPASWPEEASPPTPEEVADEWGIEDPEGRALLKAVYDRLADQRLPKRDHRQRGVGGHPRPHTLKADEQPEG